MPNLPTEEGFDWANEKDQELDIIRPSDPEIANGFDQGRGIGFIQETFNYVFRMIGNYTTFIRSMWNTRVKGRDINWSEQEIGDSENKIESSSAIKKRIELHKQEENPHRVTKAQVGLSNIPNAKSDSISLDRSDVLATSKAVRDLHNSALTTHRALQSLAGVIGTLNGNINKKAFTSNRTFTDLNGSFTTGLYQFSGGILNVPTGMLVDQDNILLVLGTNQTAKQIVFTNDSRIWLRSKNADGYPESEMNDFLTNTGAWYEMVTTANTSLPAVTSLPKVTSLPAVTSLPKLKGRVVIAGSVTLSGDKTLRLGTYEVTQSGSQFTISHYLENTDYIVNAMCTSSTSHSGSISRKNENDFIIYFADDTSAEAQNFDFEIRQY